MQHGRGDWTWNTAAAEKEIRGVTMIFSLLSLQYQSEPPQEVRQQRQLYCPWILQNRTRWCSGCSFSCKPCDWVHCMFLEHWNRQKIISDIRQRFSCLLDERIEKKCKFFFSRWLFFFKSTLSVLRCTWTGRINLKIFLGYDINYLSIWPFMRHPWFPTRKASKLTFICFQLQLLNTIKGLNNWSWKQTNVSFEAFLVGNQGWCIKGQMLR